VSGLRINYGDTTSPNLTRKLLISILIHEIVKICIMWYLAWHLRAVSYAGYAVLSPRRMGVEKSGERCLELGFTERYASAGDIEYSNREGKVQESDQ